MTPRAKPERPARHRESERGVALLMTLLVVTLLTVVILEFTDSTNVDAHLTRHALSATQAHYLARAGVVLAELTLEADLADKGRSQPARNFDALTDAWAQPVAPVELGEGTGRAGFAVVDESGRFNVNALSIPPGNNPMNLEARKEVFQQGVLAGLGLDKNLLFPLLDWLDADDEVSAQHGAESEYYQGLSPAYQPRNGRMLSLDELALVQGYADLTAEQWAGLRETLTVLPNDQLRINVNTASETLLTAIFSAFDAAAVAKAIVGQRLDHPYVSMAEVQQLPGWSQIPPQIRQMFDVKSQTFTIHGIGFAGDIARGVAVTVSRAGAGITEADWREEPAALTLTSPGSGGINPLLP